MHLTRFRAGFAALALLLSPVVALAGNTPVYQSGTILVPHNLAKITRDGQIQDASPLGVLGDAKGRGINPFAVTDKKGLGLCSYTTITGDTTGALCLGHDSSGNAIFSVDGVTYPFNGSGNATMPTSPVVPSGNLTMGNGAQGLTDSTITSAAPAAGSGRVFRSTNVGPGASTYHGVLDYFRSNVGSYPTTGEFAGDTTANIGAAQALVGAIVQPLLAADVSAYFGVAGYAACSTGVGFGGSCVGVSGNGIALGNGTALKPGLAIGLNSVATNSSQVSNTQPNTGYDYIGLTSVEIDLNLMKFAGAAPHANAVGISIVGVSETQPAVGFLADAIFIQPMGLSPLVRWRYALQTSDGAAEVGLDLGAFGQGTGASDAQKINMWAYDSGSARIGPASISYVGSANFWGFNVPGITGEIALQVNSANILNVKSNGITASAPIAMASGIGANGVALSPQTTAATVNSQVLILGATLSTVAVNGSLQQFSNGYLSVNAPAGGTVALQVAAANALTATAAMVTVAGGLTLTGVPVSGTATGSLCVSAGSIVYIKTTAGACL